MRKQTLVNYEVELIQQIDSFLIMPCSRADLLNDMAEYLLKSPSILTHFVSQRNEKMKLKAESNITQ